MDIDNDQHPAIYGLSSQYLVPQRPEQSFAKMLEAERVKAQNDAARSAVLADQKFEPKNDNTEDIDFIRQKGIRAYTEEIHRKKQEELREKILFAMGLTEELLSEMTAGQRQAIEELIAQEIQERMAADSMTNGGSENEEGENGPAAIGDINPANLLAAHVLIGDSGALIGLLANQEDKGKALESTLSGNSGDDDGTG